MCIANKMRLARSIFNPHDAQDLAENMLKVQQNSKPGIDALKEKQAYESMCTRTRDFGTSFLELMQQVAGS